MSVSAARRHLPLQPPSCISEPPRLQIDRSLMPPPPSPHPCSGTLISSESNTQDWSLTRSLPLSRPSPLRRLPRLQPNSARDRSVRSGEIYSNHGGSECTLIVGSSGAARATHHTLARATHHSLARLGRSRSTD